jgi:hypothetical protein
MRKIKDATSMETTMPRGDKSKYTDKEKRQAEHIEEGYEERGIPEDEGLAQGCAFVAAANQGGRAAGHGHHGVAAGHGR